MESLDADRAVPSLGPTDVDSDGEVVEEDFSLEAQSQADSDDEPVWSLPVHAGRFGALAGDEGVLQRQRWGALCSGWRLLFQRVHIQMPRTFLKGSQASEFAHFADHAGSDNEKVERARLTRSMRDAFASLDHVDLQVEFRCCIVRSPPMFLRGLYRSAMRLALSEFQHVGEDEDRQCRAWKLFCFSRMFLFRHARGGLLPKGQLQERFHQFSQV